MDHVVVAPRWSRAQLIAAGTAALLVLGILGFILTGFTNFTEMTNHAVFGLFQTNGFHNVVYLILGVFWLLGASLMVGAGLTMASTTLFWLLLVAATAGVISPSGQEVGPFLPIEQAALTNLTTDQGRTRLHETVVRHGGRRPARARGGRRRDRGREDDRRGDQPTLCRVLPDLHWSTCPSSSRER